MAGVGLAGPIPADDAEEEAMLAAAMKLSLEQAASDAVAQPGDPAVQPTAGLLGLFATVSTADRTSERSASLRHLMQTVEDGEGVRTVELGYACVGTDASYYYYGCSGDADRGWGCAYRCAQMIVDSIALSPKVRCTHDPLVKGRQRVLPIVEIQRVLAGLEERPKFGVEIIGSTTWIEPPDVAAYLLAQHRVRCVQSEVALSDHAALDALCTEVWAHFDCHQCGSAEKAWIPPVMIDDTMFAYCIAGVAASSASPPWSVDTCDSNPGSCSDDHSGTVPRIPHSSSLRASTWCLVMDPHVSDPQLDGRAPTGITLAHFRTPPAPDLDSRASAADFKSTAPLPRPGVVRWLRFDEVFVEGCRGKGWMVCR